MRINKSLTLLLILLLSTSFSPVSFAEQDITPPTLNSISVDKISVTVDETFTLTVNLTDDVSGVETAWAEYESPSKRQRKYATLMPISEGNFQADYVVEQYDEIGVWNVQYVYIRDYAGNTVNYPYNGDFDLNPASIEFYGTTPDTIPPNLNTINVDKLSATVDETFTLIVNLTDDVSGVAAAWAEYESPSKRQRKYATLMPISEGNYQADYIVGQYDEIGVWNVQYVYIRDYAGNTANYPYNGDFDLNPASIEFYGTTPDTIPPTLNMIGVSKDFVSVGDVFTLSVNLTDDVSGVAAAWAEYESPSKGQRKYATLIPISEGNYQADYTVGQYDEIGVWNVQYVYIRDYAGNTANYPYNGDFDLSPADIEFRNADNQPPTITTNVLMYSVLQKGDILEFDAIDLESGMKTLTATLSDGTTSFEIQSPHILTDGIYTLEITAEDLAGNIASHLVEFVVYNPECVSVTGGGWINSPTGTYMQDLSLEGKATFSFSIKYNKFSTIPVGNVVFEFPMGGLKFSNTTLDWLIISNSTAQIKGSGTINEQGGFGFAIVVRDEKDLQSGIDRFRIKIWDKSNNQLIYDNALDPEGYVNFLQDSTLIHGNIVIHKK